MKANTGDGTAALDKALDVLDAIGAAPQGLSQVDLSARLAVPRTTLYRLLATLVARGMIRRDPLRRVYCLGFRCFELARKAHANPDLVAAASLELRALRDLTGETSYLAVLDGLEVLSLERCDGAHSQRSQSAVGQRKPLHCTSQGKAILSALDDATRDALVRELPLAAVTPRSITDRRRLQAELRFTAARGWSVDDEEIVPGVRCVGAPIVDSAGKVRGAISVAGPAFRMTLARVEGLGPEVAEAARRVGAQIGAAPAQAVPSEATPVDGPWAFKGAFPRWSAPRQCLYWADALAPAVRVIDAAGDRELVTLDAPLTGLVLWQDGLLAASADGWCLIDGLDGVPRAGPLQPWPGARPVALCNGPAGDLWACAAAMDGGSGPRWQVGRFTPGSALEVAWQTSEALDALAWDARGEWLYGVAGGSGTILMMGAGQSALRRLATVPKGSGRLSGVAVDAQGGVWAALQDGWGVVRFSPDGALDRVIGLPVPGPTDLALGGADGATLFITSARHSVSIESLGNAPLSGRIFAVNMDENGQIPARDGHSALSIEK